MIRSWLLHRERWQLAALAVAAWIVIGVVVAVWYELIGQWRRWRAYRRWGNAVRGRFMVDRVERVVTPFDALSRTQCIVRSELQGQEEKWNATRKRKWRDGKAGCLIVGMLAIAFVALFLVQAITRLTIIKCVVIGIIYGICVLVIDLCIDRHSARERVQRMKDHSFKFRSWE